MKKNAWFKTAVAAMLAVALTAAPASCAHTVYADSSDDSSKQFDAPEWNTIHYSRDGQQIETVYMGAITVGQAVEADNTNSRLAYAELYSDAAGFTFALYNNNNDQLVYNNTDSSVSLNAYLSASITGLERVPCTIELPAGSSEWNFGTLNDGTTNAGTIVHSELLNGGGVQLIIQFDNYAPGSDYTFLNFEIPGMDGTYSTMFRQLTDAGWVIALPQAEAQPEIQQETQPETSVYSNAEIEEIVTNYLNTYNAMAPGALQTYNDFMGDSYVSLIGDLLTYAQPIYDFYEAMTVFDSVVYSDMTPEQQTYYTNAKTSVNTDTVGHVVELIKNCKMLFDYISK